MNNSINSIYKQRSYRVHTQPILQSYLQACSAEQCLTIHAERKCYESSAATPYFMFLSGLKQLQGLPSRLCSARSASRFTTAYFDALFPPLQSTSCILLSFLFLLHRKLLLGDSGITKTVQGSGWTI